MAGMRPEEAEQFYEEDEDTGRAPRPVQDPFHEPSGNRTRPGSRRVTRDGRLFRDQ
jgi:hypothetical protein